MIVEHMETWGEAFTKWNKIKLSIDINIYLSRKETIRSIFNLLRAVVFCFGMHLLKISIFFEYLP